MFRTFGKNTEDSTVDDLEKTQNIEDVIEEDDDEADEEPDSDLDDDDESEDEEEVS